ncbi:MAG: hypothetical protein KAI09_03330, partial [Dehalococcoidales bacterium]|nr:hypothetical protein [Dehalococcoidales bacterium]
GIASSLMLLAMTKRGGCLVMTERGVSCNDREREMARNDKRRGCVAVVCHYGYFIFIENQLANT